MYAATYIRKCVLYYNSQMNATCKGKKIYHYLKTHTVKLHISHLKNLENLNLTDRSQYAVCIMVT